jgi:retrograde regulation protein 2
MKAQFRQAYNDLDLPDSLRQKADHGGLTLYLSGGGFRGWGYLLMSQHRVSPYPLPIINGFCVTKRDFEQTAEMSTLAAEESVFRISKRRAEQVPAVAFLVNVLVDALPMIQHVQFCQGGVREGFLYDTLDASTKALDPLEAATAQYGTSSAADLAALLWDSLPGANHLDRSLPSTFTPSFVRAVANMMYLHLPLPKETRSLAALHAPVTGVLASAHGISHANRAILALTLCARWGSDLPPPHNDFKARLSAITTNQEGFWAKYLGSVAALVGTVYPAGNVDARHPRLKFSARWADGLGKKGLAQGVRLKLQCRREDPMTCPMALSTLVNELEKVGKKKNRVGGEHGYGVPIEVGIERDLI